MKSKTIIIVALENELHSNAIPAQMPIVYSGIGKLNAAMATFQAINTYQPTHIINFGTVGKINLALHGLIDVRKVIQRDMLVEPFAPRGDVPFSTQPNAYFSNSGTYTCGTGDSFVQNNDPWLAQQGVDIVDMELFAIAKVACAFNISWSAYKFISDEANDNSVNDWQSQINLGQTQFLEKLKSII